MIKLDDNLLAELGLHVLPPEEKKNLLRHIYETLEMRVGTTLAQQMTDAQLDEFEGFINANDEAGALRWLESNFPNYKDVVAQEFEKLKAEVRQAAPQLLASVQHAPQMQQPMQQMPPQQPYAQPQMSPQYQQQPAVPQYGPAPVAPMPQQQPQYAQPMQPQMQQQVPQQPQYQQPPIPQQYNPMPQQPAQPDQSQFEQAS